MSWKFWADFAPTAAVGALTVIAVPMILVALPFWAVGAVVVRLFDLRRLRAALSTQGEASDG